MLDRAKKCISAVIEKRLKEITDAPQMPEYAGVFLFMLKKKQRQLEKKRFIKLWPEDTMKIVSSPYIKGDTRSY